ncbi:MAG TPA: hypothetical protein VNA25_09480 [Phycisphaerae bacterium]|nr:hypothetical protein [Phycisphaerae bacterium]
MTATLVDQYWRGELDDLLEVESGLSNWEVEFIETVDANRPAGKPPSDKQIAKIHEIWDRRCGR